jgi:uncharacterized protein YceK
MNSIRNVFAVLALLLVSGCTSYYRVTDPTTGTTYYTTSKSYDDGKDGAASFVDAHTGDKVTIQNSRVAKITEQQYDNGKDATSSTVTSTTQP